MEFDPINWFFDLLHYRERKREQEEIKRIEDEAEWDVENYLRDLYARPRFHATPDELEEFEEKISIQKIMKEPVNEHLSNCGMGGTTISFTRHECRCHDCNQRRHNG